MRLVAYTLFLATLASAQDADTTQPNQLTRAEITEGWILLFDGETTFGWKVKGKARVEDGDLVLGGKVATKAQSNLEFSWMSQSYTLEAEMMWSGDKPPKLSMFGLRGSTLRDDAKQGYVQETARAECEVAPDFGPAREPIVFEVPAGTELRVRNVRFCPLNMESIFNGSDLSEWRVIDGSNKKRPGRFEVTDEGELSITNGPGDIQTVGEWDDFVFQAEIFVNGDHLNSGVFFRGTAGNYWSGYESQIRNQWKGDDRNKPVDFGTGGIYGRKPARRVMSSDREWFTKTVIACGNHIAVWIDGIQVSDFRDKRPANQNARSGKRLGKGPISLQAHDPKTDLRFRELRVGTWGAKPRPKPK